MQVFLVLLQVLRGTTMMLPTGYLFAPSRTWITPSWSITVLVLAGTTSSWRMTSPLQKISLRPSRGMLRSKRWRRPPGFYWSSQNSATLGNSTNHPIFLSWLAFSSSSTRKCPVTGWCLTSESCWHRKSQSSSNPHCSNTWGLSPHSKEHTTS